MFAEPGALPDHQEQISSTSQILDQQPLNITGTVFHGHNSRATSSCSYVPPTSPRVAWRTGGQQQARGGGGRRLPLSSLSVSAFLVLHVQIHKRFRSVTDTHQPLCFPARVTVRFQEGEQMGLRRAGLGPSFCAFTCPCRAVCARPVVFAAGATVGQSAWAQASPPSSPLYSVDGTKIIYQVPRG